MLLWIRSLPGHKHRKDFVDDYEYDLTQHPLALYPHLEECMPSDVSQYLNRI